MTQHIYAEIDCKYGTKDDRICYHIPPKKNLVLKPGALITGEKLFCFWFCDDFLKQVGLFFLPQLERCESKRCGYFHKQDRHEKSYTAKRTGWSWKEIIPWCRNLRDKQIRKKKWQIGNSTLALNSPKKSCRSGIFYLWHANWPLFHNVCPFLNSFHVPIME